MTDEIHDTSRLDAYMRARRRVAFLHAVWKPMLAGALGAALVIGCVWVVLPKLSIREVVVDHVVQRDAPVDHVVPKDIEVDHVVPHDVQVDHVVPHDVATPNIVPHDVQVDHVVIVPHDVQVDHVVPHEVEIGVPRIVQHEVEIGVPRVVEAAPAPLATPTETQAETQAPRSPEERAFIDTEEWRDAVVRGRILRSDKNGFVVSTDTGEWGFWPAKLNAAGKLELNPLLKDRVEDLIGDLTRCNRQSNKTYRCFALHDGQEVLIPQTPIGHST